MKRLPFLKNRIPIRRNPMGNLRKKAIMRPLRMMGGLVTRTSLEKTSLRKV